MTRGESTSIVKQQTIGAYGDCGRKVQIFLAGGDGNPAAMIYRVMINFGVTSFEFNRFVNKRFKP